MSRIRIHLVLAFSLLPASVLAIAQTPQKPGLWEVTSTMTWQKSPMPPGVTLPPGVQNPFGPTTHTNDVCLTQEMLDKFGMPLNVSQAGESCAVSNIVRKPGGMTADMTCTGKMNARATIEATVPDPGTAHSKVHFTGAMAMGTDSLPVEYTVESNSVYKSADCGSVKPLPMPTTK